MTLREIVLIKTFPLKEEKTSSFVLSIINRYDNPLRASRIEAIYNSKSDIGKRLYSDYLERLSKNDFRKACIAKFRDLAKSQKLKLKEHEFVSITNEFLSHFDDEGKLIPLVSK